MQGEDRVRRSARDAPSPEEALRLVHELQVHQVELEMQNEELRRAQEELEASRARYFDLYDQAPVGYVTLNPQGLIIEANLTAAAMLGVARGALVKRPFLGLLHPDDRDACPLQGAQLDEEGTRHSWDTRMTRADGSLCWAHVQAALPQKGECRITLNDISERKRVEASLALADTRLRHLQKAESLGRMAGAVAHHFNNKLHAVIGSLELALDEQSRGVGSMHSLGIAMRAAIEASEMSSLMRTFTGRTTGQLMPLDLSQACHRLLPLLRAALPTGVPLETDLPASGPTVSASEEQMPQLLINLVTNAGEAVGTRTGAVRLSVTTVAPADIPEVHRYPVDWEPQDASYACIEVADTGRGMADKDLERVFDPFFSEKDTGRGLGLSVVLGIVRGHRGAVSVRSEPGRGSTFRVFLPLFLGEAARSSPKGGAEVRPGGTVLVVEDDDLVRSVTSAMLRGLGFSVLAVSGGSEAVAELGCNAARIGLVLCDLSMPGMDGWETLAALRRIVPGIPVILCSGYDRSQAMSGHHPELPQAFLRKPYRQEDLSEAIRRARGAAAATPTTQAR
ncbi:MAG TPA: ATP-binding protein [bacterium]